MKGVIELSSKSPRIQVTFDPETYQQFKNIAYRHNQSLSETVRIYATKSLTPDITKENLDYIVDILHTQIKDIIAPYMERSIALSAKACIQSGTAAYLAAESIARFVPPELQEDVGTTYEAARKKAVIYTRQKGEFPDD